MDPEEANFIATRASRAMCEAAADIVLENEGKYLAAVMVPNETGKRQVVLGYCHLPDEGRDKFLREVLAAVQQEIDGVTVGRRVWRQGD